MQIKRSGYTARTERVHLNDVLGQCQCYECLFSFNIESCLNVVIRRIQIHQDRCNLDGWHDGTRVTDSRNFNTVVFSYIYTIQRQSPKCIPLECFLKKDIQPRIQYKDNIIFSEELRTAVLNCSNLDFNGRVDPDFQ